MRDEYKQRRKGIEELQMLSAKERAERFATYIEEMPPTRRKLLVQRLTGWKIQCWVLFGIGIVLASINEFDPQNGWFWSGLLTALIGSAGIVAFSYFYRVIQNGQLMPPAQWFIRYPLDAFKLVEKPHTQGN